MAGSVVGGGGGGGGGGASALKPLIDALDKNSAAISSQSDKQGEAKLAKMMEDLSAALELMVSFITRLNDSIAGLKLGFSTLAGALNTAAKAQSSQKPVKPLTAKQQNQANKDQEKAAAKVLAQDKNLSYKREKDDKNNLARQLAQEARLAASIIKAQLKADKPKKSDKPPQIMGPFLHEEQTAKNKAKDDAAAEEKKDQQKFEADFAKLYSKEEAERLKVISDAANKAKALEKESSVEIEANIKENQAARIKSENETAAEIQANIKETAKVELNAARLVSEQKTRDESRSADQYVAIESARKKAESDYLAAEKKNNAKMVSLKKEYDAVVASNAKDSADAAEKASMRRVAADIAQMAASEAALQSEPEASKSKEKPPQIMGPFLYEKQVAENAKDKRDESDYIASEKKNNAKIEALKKESDDFIASSAKESADAAEKASIRRVAADIKQIAASEAALQSEIEAAKQADAQDAAKKSAAKVAEEKGASNSVLGVDLGAIGYKMEEFGKAATVAGAAMTAAGIPVGPMFTAVATASKYMGTTLRWTATIAKGLISAFSWLKSTVSALAKSAAVYAPAIAQMAEMALRDLSAVMGAAAAPIAAAFIPIVRAISDRLFPVTRDAGAAGGDVVKSFGPLIDGIMAILAPTMTFLIAVFRLLWAVIGPVIEVIGGLVQILGSLWGAIMVLFTVMVDWMMPAFELLGAALSFLAKALKMAADGIAWAFSWLIGPVDKKDRAKDAFDPASTVGLAAAQNAKMSSFQSLGESAAQSAFLTSTGGKDPQADLAQAMLNKDLPNKWAMFLDAQGKPQPIVAAQRNNAGPANPGVPGVQAGGDWMAGAAMG